MLSNVKSFVYLPFLDQLKERLESDNPYLQVVLGPRQVGKTTSVLKLIENNYKKKSIYVSAEQSFNPNPEWLQEIWLQAQAENRILFIDEIQKSYNWPEVIKALYDDAKRRKKPVKCVLLGSSSLEIQKGLTESLTGRFQLLNVQHWNFAESKKGYDLSFDEYLKFGGYPGSYPLIGSNEWYDYVKHSIVGTVVEKDILQFRTVKDPSLFRQAFDLLTSYPAHEISYTKLLGQLQKKGNVEVIKHYINLFEGAYLITALQKYSGSKLVQKSSSPKILPLAPCLSYLQIRADYTPIERGHIFEALVGQQLMRMREELYYWREGGNEVDYVLKIGKNVWAIEVKSTASTAGGLHEFKKKFPSAHLVLINENNYLDFEKDPMKFLQNYI